MVAERVDRENQPRKTVAVWDWPVRIVHWLLVVLIVVSWITSEVGGNAMTYHMWSGYTILTLVAFRIVWGWVGSRHARFASFVRGPGEVIRYATSLAGTRSSSFLGHNPLGGWSVVLMLLSVAVQATTGLFANDDVMTEGPLASRVSGEASELLTAIHNYNFYVLLALIALHLIAILFYLLVKRENLIGAMFTGRKYINGVAPAQEPMASLLRAAVVLLIVAGAVAAVVNSG
jgi:cytochrome b